MTTITVNEDRLKGFLAEREANEEEYDFQDFETLNTFVQDILDQHIFDLPEGAEAVAYYLEGEDPGFIFGLRPRPYSAIYGNVTTYFVECKHVEPRDADGRLPWDQYWHMSQLDACGQVVENIVCELESLLPAYEKVWG